MLSIVLWMVGGFMAVLAVILGIQWRTRKRRQKSVTGFIIGFFVLLGLTVAAIVVGLMTHCWHDWKPATCRSPKTCRLCHETQGKRNGHDWKKATCTEAKTCEDCDKISGSPLGHDWADATCTDAAHCTRCDATEGVALGHDLVDATCSQAAYCTRCNLSDGVALGHDWKDSTCESPKTCNRCQATEGVALGHDWADATCAAPKTCRVCNTTAGSVLDHAFSDNTCIYCGAVENKRQFVCDWLTSNGTYEDGYYYYAHAIGLDDPIIIYYGPSTDELFIFYLEYSTEGDSSGCITLDIDSGIFAAVYEGAATCTIVGTVEPASYKENGKIVFSDYEGYSEVKDTMENLATSLMELAVHGLEDFLLQCIPTVTMADLGYYLI